MLTHFARGITYPHIEARHDRAITFGPCEETDFGGRRTRGGKNRRYFTPNAFVVSYYRRKDYMVQSECLQPIGAFKIRGGWHRLTDLDENQRKRGVVAFSSGNHAQGVAWAARQLGIKATIIIPGDAPAAKLENTKKLGAEVITYDRMKESREKLAAEVAGKNGGVVVPSFDDPWIVEGQGSAGIEIRDQMIALTGSPPDQLVVCCGGGGLASGIALANPQADIIVAEPEGWDDMKRSLESGAITPVQDNPPATDCDALQTL